MYGHPKFTNVNAHVPIVVSIYSANRAAYEVSTKCHADKGYKLKVLKERINNCQCFSLNFVVISVNL